VFTFGFRGGEFVLGAVDRIVDGRVDSRVGATQEGSLAAQSATASGRQARDDRVSEGTEVGDYAVPRSFRYEPALKNERPASLPSRGRRTARTEAGGNKRNRV